MARLRTHRLMAANDFEDILYVDTDGFLTTKHNYATAEGLGSLTDRTTGKPYALTTCIRPKFYILRRRDHVSRVPSADQRKPSQSADLER